MRLDDRDLRGQQVMRHGPLLKANSRWYIVLEREAWLRAWRVWPLRPWTLALYPFWRCWFHLTQWFWPQIATLTRYDVLDLQEGQEIAPWDLWRYVWFMPEVRRRRREQAVALHQRLREHNRTSYAQGYQKGYEFGLKDSERLLLEALDKRANEERTW